MLSARSVKCEAAAVVLKNPNTHAPQEGTSLITEPWIRTLLWTCSSEHQRSWCIALALASSRSFPCQQTQACRGHRVNPYDTLSFSNEACSLTNQRFQHSPRVKQTDLDRNEETVARLAPAVIPFRSSSILRCALAPPYPVFGPVPYF